MENNCKANKLSLPHWAHLTAGKERKKKAGEQESSFTCMHRPKPRIPRWHVPTEAALFMYCASNYGENNQGRVWLAFRSNGKIKTEKAEKDSSKVGGKVKEKNKSWYHHWMLEKERKR